jgi:hypothetical protein
MSLLFSLALASLPALPEPVANNAVAKVIVKKPALLFKLYGAGAR